MERPSSSLGLVCASMIFLLSPASASIDGSHVSNDGFLHTNILDEGKPFADSQKGDLDFLRPSQVSDGEQGIPKDIMDKIFDVMKHLHAAQQEEPEQGVNNIETTNVPIVKEASISDDLPATLQSHQKPPLDIPNPTPETPNSNDTNTEDIWIKTRKRTHFDFEVYRKNKNGTTVTKYSTPEITNAKKPESELDNHLKNLWKSSVPVIVKNNKASVHPEVDYSDMSKVLPDLPSLLQKLHQVHKPGHVSVVILNPKHLPINKEAVKHTKICCAMRHVLIHSTHNNDESLPQSSSGFQDFLSGLGQPQSNEDETEPSEEDHYDDEDAESPWSSHERSVVSGVMRNLHLFDSPEHLSAISFNPRHIVQKKNPKLIHIRIRMLVPLVSSSGNSDLDNSLINENDDKEPFAFGDQSDENSLEPSASGLFPHSQSVQMKLRHQPGILTIQHIPMHHFLDSFQEALPSPPLQEQPRHFKKTIVYFIHHGPHEEGAEEPARASSSNNLRTLLKDIFNIPSQRSYPSEEYEPTHEEDILPEGYFQNNQQRDLPSIQDKLNEILNPNVEPDIPSSDEDFGEEPSTAQFPRPSTSTARFNSFHPDVEGQESSEGFYHPLNIFKLFKMQGLNLSPQFSSSNEGNFEEPEELPSHRVQINFRSRPSGADDIFRSLMG